MKKIEVAFGFHMCEVTLRKRDEMMDSTKDSYNKHHLDGPNYDLAARRTKRRSREVTFSRSGYYFDQEYMTDLFPASSLLNII